MESWRIKKELWRGCKLVAADSHQSEEELDPDPQPLFSPMPDFTSLCLVQDDAEEDVGHHTDEGSSLPPPSQQWLQVYRASC